MRLAVFLTLPSAVGLAVFAQPIIGLIYERGKFTSVETLRTAEALQFYAAGLIGYSCIKVLAPAFYALDRRWVPMLVSFAAIGLNILLNYLLIFRAGLGHRGLALSTALSATANFCILYFVMRRHLRGLDSRAFVSSLFKCGLASGVMAALLFLGLHVAGDAILHGSPFARAPWVLGLVAAGAGVFLLLCTVLRVPETHDAISLVRCRLRRGKKA